MNTADVSTVIIAQPTNMMSHSFIRKKTYRKCIQHFICKYPQA